MTGVTDPAVDDAHSIVFVTDRTPVTIGRLETERGEYLTLDIDGRHLRLAATVPTLRRLVSLGERALAAADERATP
jgi:hypothetical protein